MLDVVNESHRVVNAADLRRTSISSGCGYFRPDARERAVTKKYGAEWANLERSRVANGSIDVIYYNAPEGCQRGTHGLRTHAQCKHSLRPGGRSRDASSGAAASRAAGSGYCRARRCSRTRHSGGTGLVGGFTGGETKSCGRSCWMSSTSRAASSRPLTFGAPRSRTDLVAPTRVPPSKGSRAHFPVDSFEWKRGRTCHRGDSCTVRTP
eukprot:scaffold1232_cov105-Phaeocystis_antarctica.AAC.1